MLMSVSHRINILLDKFYYRMPTTSVAPYTTHLPVLIMLARTQKVERVLEFGSGMCSTAAFMDRRIFPHLTRLDSYENDEAWAAKVSSLIADDHRVKYHITNGPMSEVAASVLTEGYQAILIDDSQNAVDRAKTITAIARRRPAATVVVHDFDVRAYRVAARPFLRKHRFCALTPNTGVLSNNRNFKVAPYKILERLVRHSEIAQTIHDIQEWGAWIEEQSERLGLDRDFADQA